MLHEILVGGKISAKNYSESRFKLTFWVSRDTFKFILERIRPDLERKTVVEEPISAKCCLAVCLYRLGRGDYLYTSAKMTGFGESTIRAVVSKACESVAQYFPKTKQQFEKILDTEQLWQFPCCWGAVDGVIYQ